MNFVVNITSDNVREERAIARRLRKSNWWKRRCAKGKCYYCSSKISQKELTMDHIVPLVRGGKSMKNNIVTACKQCNNKKKHMLLFEWEDYLTNQVLLD